MSVDMNSQGSDSNEEDYDPNCEEEEEDEDPGDIEDYYVGVASDVEQQGAVVRRQRGCALLSATEERTKAWLKWL